MAAIRVCSVLSALTKRHSATVSASYLQLRCLSSGAVCTPGQWQLVSAVCLQRLPVITAEKSPLEERFGSLMEQLELESSLLSNHELHAREDQAIAEKRKQLEESEQGEGEVEGARVTALDLEDAWEAEAKLFAPAARVTDADTKNDQRSVERRLDQPLVLLVRQTLGDKHWVFPQGPRQEGESMRQAAERVLRKLCGEAVSAQFLGNAPCGFYQYRYPPAAASLGTGAKVFFFKAWYKGGDVAVNKEDTTDYMWVTRDELPNFCSRAYLKSVKDFIVDL